MTLFFTISINNIFSVILLQLCPSAYIGDYLEEEKYGFCIHYQWECYVWNMQMWSRTLLHWIVKWWRLSLLHTLWFQISDSHSGHNRVTNQLPVVHDVWLKVAANNCVIYFPAEISRKLQWRIYKFSHIPTEKLLIISRTFFGIFSKYRLVSLHKRVVPATGMDTLRTILAQWKLKRNAHQNLFYMIFKHFTEHRQ